MTAQATAALTVKVGVLGADALTGLASSLAKVSQAARRAAGEQVAASTRAVGATTRAGQAQARMAERVAREQDRWNAWVEQQKYKIVAREHRDAERIATMKARAAERAARAEVRESERSTRAQVSGLRTVEGEMRRLEMLAKNRETTAQARAAIGMGPSIMTGHGFVNRTRQGIGLMRDLAVAGMGVRFALGAAAAGVGAMVGPMMDFEAKLAEVKNKGGFTDADMAAIKKAAMHQGRTGQFSATQSAGAAVELAAAGLSAGGIESGMPSVLRFAQAGGLNTESAAAIMVESMAQFGLAASDFERIGNTMVKGANMSTISVADMAESMKYVGPLAAAAGMDIEQTAATIALLGESGLKGSMGGTGLRTVLASLVKPAKQAKEAMASIGLSKADMQKGLSDLPAFMKTLSEKMAARKFSQPQRLAVLKSMFGTEGMTAAEILMKSATQLGTDGKTAWGKFTDGVREADTAMKDAADTNANTLAGKMARLKAAAESAQIALGEGLAPTLTKLLPKMAGAAVSVGEWIGKNQGLVQSLAVAVPSVIAMTAATNGLMGVASMVDKLPVQLTGKFAAAGASAGTTFAAAMVAGVAGYGVATALLKVFDIDMAKVGAKLNDLLNSDSQDNALRRNVGVDKARPMSLKEALDAERKRKEAAEKPAAETDPILRAMQIEGEGVPAALAPRQEWNGKLEIEITSEGKPRVVNLKTDGPQLKVGHNIEF